MAKQEFKPGDLVRVPGRTEYLCFSHDLPQGSVCEVARVLDYSDYLLVELRHPCGRKQYTQAVNSPVLKLAKQAMRKREQYGNRRG